MFRQFRDRGLAVRREGRALGFGALICVLASPGHAQVPTDQMSCAAAVQTTQQSGIYNKRTGFGVVPIRPSYLMSRTGTASCPPRYDISFFIERTLDNPACVLGYSCIERVRLRN